MSHDPQKIADALFAVVEDGESLYAILDAARTFDIPFHLRSASVEYDSLYRGQKEETLWHVAPYLVRCERDSQFFQWVLEQGWGASWGIFLTSEASLEDLRKHFRQFLLVKIEEDDKEVYFRFYDPRVLRAFLLTWTPQETTEFFGPVRYYLLEAEEPEILLKFTDSQKGARQDAVPFSAPGQAEAENSAS
jgi:hypothetical protein